MGKNSVCSINFFLGDNRFQGLFTRSNFNPINIENFCVRDGICWCSHDPVFASNYFVTSSKNFNNSCFENFMPTSPQLWRQFCKNIGKIEHGKIKVGGSFDLTQKLLETCQKLALTRPIVV